MSKATKTGYTLNLKGKSGQTYTFILYDGIPDLGKVGGLYIFTKVNDTGSHAKIYLGRTGDLSTRFEDHHKTECIKKNGANRFGVCLMESEKDRVKSETDLLEANNFTCNEKNN